MALQEESLKEMLSVFQPRDYEATEQIAMEAAWPDIDTPVDYPRTGYFYFCFLYNSAIEAIPTKLIINNARKGEHVTTGMETATCEIYEVTDTETEGTFLIGKKISSRIANLTIEDGQLVALIEEGTRIERGKKYIIKLKTRYREVNRKVGIDDWATQTDGYWFDLLWTRSGIDNQPNQIREFDFGNVAFYQDVDIQETSDPIYEGQTINFLIEKMDPGYAPWWFAASVELWGLNWRDLKISYNEIVGLAGKGANERALEPSQVLIFLEQARAELVHQIKKDVFTDWDNLTEEGRNLINSITAYLSAIKIVNYDYEGYGSRFEAREISNYLQEQADRLIELLKDKDTLKFAEDGT